jgi:hypothetical protein
MSNAVVSVQRVPARTLAAVRREVRIGEIARAFGPALDEVWAGEVALAVHVGPYDGLARTHDKLHAWQRTSGRAFAGRSWEIYGDWNEDPSKLETTIAYLLR